MGELGEEKGEVAKMQNLLCYKSVLPASKHKNKESELLSGGAVAGNPWQLSEQHQNALCAWRNQACGPGWPVLSLQPEQEGGGNAPGLGQGTVCQKCSPHVLGDHQGTGKGARQGVRSGISSSGSALVVAGASASH